MPPGRVAPTVLEMSRNVEWSPSTLNKSHARPCLLEKRGTVVDLDIIIMIIMITGITAAAGQASFSPRRRTWG